MRTIKYLLLPALAVGCAQAPSEASARASRGAGADARALQKVTRLAVSGWSGDRGFRRRMQRDIGRMGFRFVDYAHAEALVSARTSWSRGAFTGEVWIRDLKGRVLWHQSARRPASSGVMASDRLAASLRAALQR